MNCERILVVSICLLGIGFFLLSTGSTNVYAQDTVKIGVFGPMSGAAAAYGVSLQQGTALVAKEVNAAGGVLGKKIELIYGDDAGKPDEAVNVVNRFISKDNVLMVIGSTSSPCSFSASQVTWRNSVPHIISTGTAARITLQGNPWIFRSTVPDTKVVKDLVDFIHEKFPKVRKFAFLYVNDDFGKGGFDAFVEPAKKYGYEVIIQEKYARGDLDFTAQLGRIKASSPDALMEVSRYHEGALIRKQMQSMGFKLPHFGLDGHSHPKFLELAGDAANGFYYGAMWSPATSADFPASVEFMARFKKEYAKEPDYGNAIAYDAMNLAVLGIKKAGNLDRTKIRDALRTIDYKSTRGDFKFDQNGDPLLMTHVVKVVNGKEANGRKEPSNF